jgi:hypothetical protein
METVMHGIGKHAVFYRGYLTDDRSLIPLTIALATIVALWLLVYLVSIVGPAPKAQTIHSAQHSSYAITRQMSR